MLQRCDERQAAGRGLHPMGPCLGVKPGVEAGRDVATAAIGDWPTSSVSYVSRHSGSSAARPAVVSSPPWPLAPGPFVARLSSLTEPRNSLYCFKLGVAYGLPAVPGFGYPLFVAGGIRCRLCRRGPVSPIRPSPFFTTSSPTGLPTR